MAATRALGLLAHALVSPHNGRPSWWENAGFVERGDIEMTWLVLAVVWLLISTSANADVCATPEGLHGEPYRSVAAASERDLRLFLSEYMYRHRWQTHAEAASAGFRPGDRVYGEVLGEGDKAFSLTGVAAWRRAYESSSRKRFLSSLGQTVDMAAVDARMAGWVLRVCLDGGVWSRVSPIDDCRFRFSAGVTRANRATPVSPTSLDVRGASCGRWPAGPLTYQGAGVECVRRGDGQVDLALKTDGGGTTRQSLPAIRASPPVAEPVLQTRLSAPAVEVVRLTRSQDYRLVGLNVGCPNCELYAADLRPSIAGGVIVDVSTISSSGTGWQRCPAGLRCRVFEFSPVDEPNTVGCAGLTACRVWRLAETDAEGVDVIQLTVQSTESTCLNCPPGTTYDAARASWEVQRAKTAPRCPVR